MSDRKMERLFFNELVTTTYTLFEQGTNDPHYEQIAAAYMDGRPAPNSLVQDVRQKLGRIAKALDEDGYKTCPLAEPYYRRFRRKGVKTRDEAVRSLAMGRGKDRVGLMRLVGPEDDNLIWLTWITQQSSLAAGKTRRVRSELVAALQAGHLSDDTVRQLVQHGEQAALPENAAAGPLFSAGDVPAIKSGDQ